LYGAKAVTVGISQNELGAVLRAQGRHEEVLSFLRAALAVREATPGEEWGAAITRDELGCCLQALGRAGEARAARLRAGLPAVVCSNEVCSRTARAAGVEHLLCCQVIKLPS
jgi:hypothetical protein